jgi:hypothetical protein
VDGHSFSFNSTICRFQAAKLGYPPVPANGSDILTQWQIMVLAPQDDYYSFLFVSCNGLDITAQVRKLSV